MDRTPNTAVGARKTSSSTPPHSRTSQCPVTPHLSKPTMARQQLRLSLHNMAKASLRQALADRWAWESQGCGQDGLPPLVQRVTKGSHRYWKSWVSTLDTFNRRRLRC